MTLPLSALDALETRAALALRTATPGSFPPWADQHDAAAILALVEEVRSQRLTAGTVSGAVAGLRLLGGQVRSILASLLEVRPDLKLPRER